MSKERKKEEQVPVTQTPEVNTELSGKELDNVQGGVSNVLKTVNDTSNSIVKNLKD